MSFSYEQSYHQTSTSAVWMSTVTPTSRSKCGFIHVTRASRLDATKDIADQDDSSLALKSSFEAVDC
jgi:hypothetical protein